MEELPVNFAPNLRLMSQGGSYSYSVDSSILLSYYYASVCKENVCVGVSHLYTSRASNSSKFNTLSSLQSQAAIIQ